MALIDQMAAALRAVSDDLEAEINERYDSTKHYSVERQRWIRDTAPVRAARLLLDEHEHQKARTSPQLDALLCELGALGVRLDVLAGK